MGTIEEVIEDVKETVKDNKGLVVAGAVVIVIVVLLTKDRGSSTGSSIADTEEYELATSYSSYPDAVTNANTIIDSLQNAINASDDNIKEYMSDSFSVTNDYMTEGLQKVAETNTKLQDTTIQSTDTIRNDIATVNTSVNNVQSYLTTTVTPKIDAVQSTVNTVSNTVNTVKNTVTNTANSVKKVETNTNTIKKAVSTAKPTTTAKTTAKTTTSSAKKTTTSNTIKKTSYKGNSIVDGLKSVGVNSSYDNRKKIAQANGIKNYTGTASQNTALLNKLKAGTLKKA